MISVHLIEGDPLIEDCLIDVSLYFCNSHVVFLFQLAVGQSHFAVVTVENELFTWAVSIHATREITKFETFAVHNVGKKS